MSSPEQEHGLHSRCLEIKEHIWLECLSAGRRMSGYVDREIAVHQSIILGGLLGQQRTLLAVVGRSVM